MDVVKIATLTFCLVMVCLVPVVRQRGRGHDVYSLLCVVLWMLFMFTGNMYIPDLSGLSGSAPVRVAAMIVWLVLAWLPAAGCTYLMRRAVRVRA